jgi:hypothetical protein
VLFSGGRDGAHETKSHEFPGRRHGKHFVGSFVACSAAAEDVDDVSADDSSSASCGWRDVASSSLAAPRRRIRFEDVDGVGGEVRVLYVGLLLKASPNEDLVRDGDGDVRVSPRPTRRRRVIGFEDGRGVDEGR